MLSPPSPTFVVPGVKTVQIVRGVYLNYFREQPGPRIIQNPIPPNSYIIQSSIQQ